MGLSGGKTFAAGPTQHAPVNAAVGVQLNISYDMQLKKDGTETQGMPTMATRSRVNGGVFKVRPPTRAAAGCDFPNAKKIDEPYLWLNMVKYRI